MELQPPSNRKLPIPWLLLALIGLAGLIWIHSFHRNLTLTLNQIIRPVDPLPQKIISASSYQNRLLALDTEKKLFLQQGDKILYSAQLPVTASAVVPDPARKKIFVAGADNIVYEFSEDLQLLRQTPIPGLIRGLARTAEGRLAVCYGLSAYGPDYVVAPLNPDLTLAADAAVKTGFCTALLVAGANHFLYATVDSRLGLLSSDLQPLHTATAPQRPMGLELFEHEKNLFIALGDFNGGLSLLDKNLHPLWRTRVSLHPVNTVTFCPEQSILIAADRKGVIYVYDLQGRRITSMEDKHADQPYVGFWRDGAAFRMTNLSGQVKQIDLDRAAQMRWSTSFRAAFWPANALFALLALIGIVKSVPRFDRKARWFLQNLRAYKTAYLLLLPTFAFLLVFSYYPVLTAFYYSFTKFSLSAPAEFVGLDNYRRMFQDPYVWIGLKNMFIFLAANILKTLTFPLLAAELVYWLVGDRIKQVFRTAFVVPTIVPVVVFILLWRMIYDPYNGLLNEILKAVGLAQYTHAWLSEEGFAMASIIFAGFPWVNCFAFLIYLGGLINISKDIYEAAEIDGISAWKRFWEIDLPLIRPQIKLLIVFVFIGSVQDFTYVLIFTGGGPNFTTYVPALHMFYQISEGANIGYAAAIGVLLFAVIFTATLFNLKMVKTHEL